MLEIGNPADEWQVDVVDRMVTDRDDHVKACVLDTFCPLGPIGLLTNEDGFERTGKSVHFRPREENHLRIAIVLAMVLRQFQAREHHVSETSPCGPASCRLIEKSDTHKSPTKREASMQLDTRQAPPQWPGDTS